MKNYNTFQFEQDLHALGIALEKRQISQFLLYYELLSEWNAVMNLTSITQYEEVLKKHFIDSLSVVKAYQAAGEEIPFAKKKMTLIDVGTGAGFPGVPLKIAFPCLKVTLLDSLHKRVRFLHELIEQLALTDIEAACGRAEDFVKSANKRESYDLCVSRAVANLSVLAEYCLPFVKPGGKFISYKSEKSAQEIGQAEKAATLLGGSIDTPVGFMLPNSDIYRNMIVINKIAKTPKDFPRKAGIAAKNPIV